jgi:hypothetical protein
LRFQGSARKVSLKIFGARRASSVASRRCEQLFGAPKAFDLTKDIRAVLHHHVVVAGPVTHKALRNPMKICLAMMRFLHIRAKDMKCAAVVVLVSIALISQSFAVLRPRFPVKAAPPFDSELVIIGDDIPQNSAKVASSTLPR